MAFRVVRLVLTAILSGLLLWPAVAVRSEELKTVALPRPRTSGGRPLLTVLKERQSIREFSSRSLPLSLTGDLLWAAFGVNRPTTGHRTAPSAMNSQELDLYVLTAEGVSVYVPESHALKSVAGGDWRAATGGQGFVKEAPLAVVLVADLSRLSKARPEDRERYAMFDAGCVSQNLYLFCASEGLATVVHEVDRPRLMEALKLRPEQRVILAHTIGYPKPAVDSSAP